MDRTSHFTFTAAAAAVRLVEVQGNHLHLIVEATDAVRLARAMQGPGIGRVPQAAPPGLPESARG
jgi:hypothetical protein